MSQRWAKLEAWEWGLVVLSVCLMASFLLAQATVDPDLWGHIRFGQLIVDLGYLPALDPYAYTSAGKAWINHEWMAEVMMASVYDGWGVGGLQMLRGLLVGSTLGLVGWRLTRGPLGPAGGMLALVIVAVGMIGGLATTRPHLFTYLFFALTLVLLVASESRPRLLWFVPPVFALWINFHGGVLAGAGVLALWALGRVLEEGGHEGWKQALVASRGWAVLGAVSALALLCNPYGWELVWFLVDTTTEARPNISEWQATPASLHFLLFLLLSLGGGMIWHQHRGKIPWSRGLVLLGLTILALTAIRHVPLFGLGVGILLADYGPELYEKIHEKGAHPMGGLQHWGTISVVLAVGGLLLWSGWKKGEVGCMPVQKGSLHYPQGAVHLIKKSRVEGNLATPFSWGEYILWHVGPGVQISMDGRRETVYPDSVYQHHIRFADGQGDWQAWLKGADLAITRPHSAPGNLLAIDEQWTLIYSNPHTHLWGQKGATVTAQVQQTWRQLGPTQLRPPRCFPG